ncbi:MAG TPA: hypothetical protein PKC69_11635 [Chitinophagaceae bacterium]|nr:hypothetical protein [Chitinophagaceae bacterium]
MRISLILLFAILLGPEHTEAQWKSYIIGVRGDTLNRVDMDGKKQGPWVVHIETLRGEPGYDEQGYYEDDKKQGKWVRFSLMGDKIAEENYRWGSLDGKSKYYTRTGGLEREETWRAIEPGKTFDTVDVVDVNDPTKVIDQVIVKVEGHTVKHGVWTYFDPEWGTILKTEEWWMDKLKTGDAIPGTEDELKPIDLKGGNKTANADKEKKEVVKPQAVLDFEKKNSRKKNVKVRDGRTGGN